MTDRDIEQLRSDFAETGEDDFLAWLARQPEGDRGRGTIVSSSAVKTDPAAIPNPCGSCGDPKPGEKSNKKSRGLGDTIAKMTGAIGIKPCGGCKKRQKYLNEKVPYRK